MPQEPDIKLPPIPEKSLDGYREEASIHRDQPLEKRCDHKVATLLSSTEIRCQCGVGWTGNSREILTLITLLKDQ